MNKTSGNRDFLCLFIFSLLISGSIAVEYYLGS